MPVVVQADPPLHRGPAAIGYSSRPPESSTPPGPGNPSRCSESSNSLKISLGRSSSGPINHPPPVIPVVPLVTIHGLPPAETPGLLLRLALGAGGLPLFGQTTLCNISKVDWSGTFANVAFLLSRMGQMDIDAVSGLMPP
ncbi:hypothetical protein Nepgr_018744 [Nepenthes gracilis]|uniref:Uncharacterized protein n=1 Tax=Nepenthes gracilis TaxID=150966 RepID=A0AAD3XTQ5_NEPGR|nr:hypothetical protein Nepgr_018744 [Nepenthes gracilis]